LGEVLSALEVTREQLVDMGILIGTDFNEGVKGIGPKKSLALVKRLGSLEAIGAEGKVQVPEEFEEVRRVFLEPQVTDSYSMIWTRIDGEAVRKIMCDRHGFSVDRVDAVVAKITSKDNVRSQKSLDSWS
jgi:flap endonuclease-1